MKPPELRAKRSPGYSMDTHRPWWWTQGASVEDPARRSARRPVQPKGHSRDCDCKACQRWQAYLMEDHPF